MEYRHDDIIKHLGEGRLKDAGAIQKDLQLHTVNIVSYCTDKYALWLDFRAKDDNRLHSSGIQLENTSEGVPLQTDNERSWISRQIVLLSVYIPRCSN